MSSERPSLPLIGGVTLLERAINYTLGCLTLVDRNNLTAPTPCRGWDVYTLLRHLGDSLDALSEAFQLGEVGLDGLAEDPMPGPLTGVRNGASRLLGACVAGGADTITVAGQPLTTGILSGTGAVEIAVHGWDLASACGQDRPIPAGLAEELLDLAPLFVHDADRPGRFADPVLVTSLADPGDRLVAFLGRDPHPEGNDR
jgi:uncharacterized protein (TIGR03086 family)